MAIKIIEVELKSVGVCLQRKKGNKTDITIGI